MRNYFFYAGLILLFTISSCNNRQPKWEYLFTGEDLSGWIQKGGEATFEVTGNTITGTSVMDTPNSFLCTRENYGDFILEYEFRVDPALNSGVQIRSLSSPEYMNGRVHGYQVEIDPSDRAWTAGIFDEARRGWLYPLSGPEHEDSRTAFRNDDWNKIRVEAIGDNIKTWLNDVPVANLFDEETDEGFIALQVHSVRDASMEGLQVMWRDIRIITESPELFSTETTAPEISYLKNKLTDKEKEEGWKLLFDGTTGNGWRGACKDDFPAEGWKIEDGILTVMPTTDGAPRQGGDIVTAEVYSNFDLRLQALLTPVANSGVKYFVKEYERDNGCSTLGPEYQVIDNNHPGLNEEQKMGALYDLKDARNVRLNPPGRWNNIRIVTMGNKVEHWLNGFKVVEYDRESEDFDQRVKASKFKDIPGYGKTGGHILLQDHGDEVSFRSIKIRVY
ncbi:MAG: DUF1080 domain-containing protein [Bacteroidales bacterium]